MAVTCPVARAALPALRQALTSPDASLRVAAAGALWSLEANTTATLPVLSAALAHENVVARIKAVDTLGDMGPAARPALAELVALGSEVGLVRQRVKQALLKIDPQGGSLTDKAIVTSATAVTRDEVPHESGEPSSPLAEEIAEWSAAIEADPNDVQAYYLRAETLRGRGQRDSALTDLTEAIRREPDWARPYLLRGAILIDVKAYDRALADLTEFIRREPANANGYNLRAMAQKRLGNYEQAYADYSEAIRLSPRTVRFCLSRSLVAKAQRANAQAIADLEEALRINPEYAAAHNNLACLRNSCADARVRDGAAAVRHARRACELSGWGHPLYLSTLAASHAEAGDFAEAMHWQRQALARAEGHAPDRVEDFKGYLRLYEARQPRREAN